MPIDPVAENTIEDENDADFELDGMFKEPNNRSMDGVTVHAQQLIFVDGRSRSTFQQSEGSAEKEPVGRLVALSSVLDGVFNLGSSSFHDQH
jgi:hypothetical protein